MSRHTTRLFPSVRIPRRSILRRVKLFFRFSFLIFIFGLFLRVLPSSRFFGAVICSPLPPRPTNTTRRQTRKHSPSSDERRQFWFQFLRQTRHVGHFDMLVRLRFDLTKRAPSDFRFPRPATKPPKFSHRLSCLIDDAPHSTGCPSVNNDHQRARRLLTFSQLFASRIAAPVGVPPTHSRSFAASSVL